MIRFFLFLIGVSLSVTAAEPAAAQDEEIEQWAIKTIATSSRSTSTIGSSDDVLFEPDGACEVTRIFTQETLDAGVTEESELDSVLTFADNAWTTLFPDEGEEWIELRFAQPVHATTVEIYETLNPGAVSRILVRDLDGQPHEVWAGTDPNSICPAVLRADFDRLDFPTQIVRLELNTARVAGYNQIDAVKLVGFPVPGLEATFSLIAEEDLRNVTRTFDPKVFADLDNDGWPDGVGRDGGVKVKRGPKYFLHNEGQGSFYFRGPLLPIPDPEITFFTNGGPVAGDYDNDGDLDLFYAVGDVAGAIPQPNLLLRNDRGVFVDVTEEAGLTAPGISVNVIWLDFDRDGFLDLYVGNWTHPVPGESAERRAIRDTQQNILYRNRGDGTFEDFTVAAGLDIQFHEADSPLTGGGIFGFFAADLNDDAWVDLYVVVPDSPNRLFFNDGGRFREAASPDIRLVAGSFGATAADFDNDGDLDLFQAASFGRGDLQTEERLPQRSTLFMNLGDEQFIDVTEGIGLQALGAADLAFGRFFDFDNDGDLDFFPGEGLVSFFENQAGNSFIERSIDGSIAVYIADLDGDGALDLIKSNRLFRNQSNDGRDDAHFLSVDLVGTQSNRTGIGATVFATTGELRQRRDLMAGDGWHQDEPLIHFGLGAATEIDQLEIRWPSGQVDVIDNIPADQRIRVIEGRNEWLPAPRTVWATPPPADLAFGENARFRAVVRPALFEPTATITEIKADLSGLGGPEEVPLEDLGNDTYAFDADFEVGGDAVMRDVEVFILQETSLGEHWINLSRNITVNDDPFTAVLESYDSTTPESFSLNQNYPNPFNSGTVIPFALPTGGEVELTVFNLAGQKVATLVKGHREAGQYKITWDGRDDAGRGLATGMYLYRLKSEAGRMQTQKLLLLR